MPNLSHIISHDRHGELTKHAFCFAPDLTRPSVEVTL